MHVSSLFCVHMEVHLKSAVVKVELLFLDFQLLTDRGVEVVTDSQTDWPEIPYYVHFKGVLY